jgi:serpin B
MKKNLISLALILIVGACKYDSQTLVFPDNKPNLVPLSAADITVSNASTDFAISLFRKAQSASTGENIFMSPLSVTMALAMVMNGASDSTKRSIVKLLNFENYSPKQVDAACKNLSEALTTMDRTVSLGLANSMWSNQAYALNDSLAVDVKNYFDGTAQSLNFSDPTSLQAINSWVASKTNNLIPNLLSQLAQDDVVFLINAIYFKAAWTSNFDPSKTADLPFYGEDGSVKNVSTMFSSGVRLLKLETSSFTLVDMPYGNRQFSMTVLMPSPGSSVSELIQRVTVDSLNHWLHLGDTVTTQTHFPKFTVNWKKDLLGDLISLGLHSYGYTQILKDNTSVKLSKVLQQAYISVNETGTEAAASTAVGNMVTAAGPPQTVVINRPFIYLIREKYTGSILFIGQMMMPSIQN